MSLRVKKEYEGVIVTRNVMGLGQVTFDPSKVDERKFENYVRMGFTEMFEEYCIYCSKSPCQCKPMCLSCGNESEKCVCKKDLSACHCPNGGPCICEPKTIEETEKKDQPLQVKKAKGTSRRGKK